MFAAKPGESHAGNSGLQFCVLCFAFCGQDTGMRIEIINTGTELMLGRVLNTHSQWLGRQLADRGYLVIGR